MRNFFEQELRKLFEDEEMIQSPTFSGRACLGTLDHDVRVRAEFVSTKFADHYDALRITVLNRKEGVIDKITLRIEDMIGKKKIPNNPYFQDGLSPYMWTERGESRWYVYSPTVSDYIAMRQEAARYLETFRERTPERSADGPKLVYICAPLRGDVEKNIEFARQKAQEVFQSGDIPICPHLMFPPIADPGNPVQDQAAREMGLKLLESCQEIRVCGSERTEGMWAEIQQAIDLEIPIKADQKAMGRTAHPKRSTRKER